MTTPNTSSVQQASDWCDANQEDSYQDYINAATTTSSSDDDEDDEDDD